MSSRVTRRGVLFSGAALAYFIGARLGYAFAIPHAFVTLWPPAGVMLALLLLSPRRDWPYLLAGGMAGSVASDLRSHYPMGLALAASIANGAESALAAWVVSRRTGPRPVLSTVRNVVEFIVGGIVVANAATSMLGALMLHAGFGAPRGVAWLTWWVGDGLGMLIVGAPIIAWSDPRARRVALDRSRRLEGAVLLVAMALASHAIFGPQPWTVRPGPYAVFPLLLWAGLRFGAVGATTASFIVASYATWDAGLGAASTMLVPGSTLDVAAQVYAFLLVASLCALLPGVSFEERTVADERRRESDARYRETDARYRAVVEAATDAIITMDDAGTVLFANAAAEVMFGYPSDRLVGQNVTVLMPERFRSREPAEVARQLASMGLSAQIDGVAIAALHRDGHEIPIEISVGVRDVAGGHVYTGVLRDVSERLAATAALRDAQDRLRFALEAVGLGTWDVDYTTGASRWSETLERLHGLEPGTFAGTFDAFVEQVHPDDRQETLAAIQRATLERTDSNVLYRSIWPDRSVHWISGVGRVFYGPNGEPVRAAGIGLDVTERRALEERIRQSQKMDAVGQLAGGVAHDFNNLLTVILSYAQLAMDALGADHPQHEDLAEIKLAGERAASLTRQLLAFSRKQIVAPRVVDLADSLRSIEPMLRRLIGEDIEIGVGAVESGNVKIDPAQVEQIILNLALNARDAMPEGGTLRLELSRLDVTPAEAPAFGDAPPGSYVMLDVSDTGTGMDAATAARIFEPFFTTKPQGKGTGLGLATVHGIVKQSGGAVAVRSELGAGTTMLVLLPRVSDTVDAARPRSATPASRHSETLLIVEDDPSLRSLATRILSRRGYIVLAAGTPHEALDIADAHAGRIDLLLTDVVLPEMNGRVLAEQVGCLRPRIRIVYMSGYTDDAVVRRGVSDGARFVQKPFEPARLLQTIRDALDEPPPPAGAAS